MLTRSPRGHALLAAPLLLACALSSAPLWARELPLRPWPATSPTPQLKLTDLEGKEWDLDKLRGKVVVLNFWASWCGPCVDEMPVLNALARAAATHGRLVVLGVNYKEGADAIGRFVREHGYGYPVLRDRSGDAFKQWTSGVMPTTILIDRTGRPRWRVVGELERDNAAFGEALNKMLQQ
jgi:cytochrome c biogenesis protein CcmG/thiol:disulfide interchange protein DsbE